MLENISLQFILFCSVAAALLGALAVLFLFYSIQRLPVNHTKAESIAQAIQDGAMTFIKEEYKIISIAVGIIALIIGYLFASSLAAMSFVLGSVSSMLTG